MSIFIRKHYASKEEYFCSKCSVTWRDSWICPCCHDFGRKKPIAYKYKINPYQVPSARLPEPMRYT